MDGLTFVYMVALVESCSMLFLSVFYIVNLSDLESNFINAITCCSRLNKVVIPEVTTISISTVLFVCFRCYGSLAVTLPMTLFLVYRIVRKPLNHISFYDPAEILNRNALRGFIHEAIFKLLFHMLSFFMFLYCLITVLIGDEVSESPPLPHTMF